MNDPNSAPFTPSLGEYHKFHVFHTYFTHMHILHYCRLVLDAYNFTIPTVFYIEIMCILFNINAFRTIAFVLIDSNNIQKQKLQML